jgi:hypothetical protein
MWHNRENQEIIDGDPTAMTPASGAMAGLRQGPSSPPNDLFTLHVDISLKPSTNLCGRLESRRVYHRR